MCVCPQDTCVCVSVYVHRMCVYPGVVKVFFNSLDSQMHILLPHTHTYVHICTSVPVRTLIDIMCPPPNHNHSYMPNTNSSYPNLELYSPPAYNTTHLIYILTTATKVDICMNPSKTREMSLGATLWMV